MFVLPMLRAALVGRGRQAARELGVLVAAGVVAAAVCGIQVAGALSTGGNTEKLDRPAESGRRRRPSASC